jgi:steroid delta-isomerase-like uncharacterized protein
MAKQYATLVHEWFERVWNQRNTQAIDQLLDPDVIIHGITDAEGKPLRGTEAFKGFHRRFLAAFPGITVEVADTVSEGDKVAARCVVRGRHEGEGLGMAATQKETEFTGMCLVRIEHGKIAEAWNSFDFLTMHTQLGTLKMLSQ